MEAKTIKEILASLPKPKDLKVSPRVVSAQAIRNYAAWMAEKRGYIHTSESLVALEKYLQGYSLLLTGAVGTGKTFFFQSLGQDLSIISLIGLSGWKLEEIETMLINNSGRDVVFDDMGAEPPVSDYGVKQEIVPLILEKRYYLRRRTHFTTNLNAEQIQARYGVRVIDRIYGMTFPITFTGESRRDCQPMPQEERR